MASLLLKHLASSLTRTAGQMSRLTLSGEGAYRCLCTLTCGPRSHLTARISSIQSLPSVFSAQCGPSLFGPCQHLPSIQSSVGMKTKSALKKRCKDCFFVRRRGRLFVFCKTNPRHKQRQG